VSTTFPDSHRDLLDARFATLATLGEDGGPQLTEVWFLFEDGELKISLNDSRLKTKNLAARPLCSLFILDLENPFRYLDVRGTARIEYDGADLRDHDGPEDKRVVVTIEPTNVFAVDMGA
jgi:PPOX class probable F420-dependent enzyme